MRRGIPILCVAMSMFLLSSYSRKKEAAGPNAEPEQLPGTLAAISYSRRVDMIWGENYSVRVSPGKIDSIDYFVEEERDYRFESGIPLEDGQWRQLETVALELWPDLTEIKPKKLTFWERRIIKNVVMLDGADSTTLSFDWETPGGIVSVNYNWKHDNPKAVRLIELLYALQGNGKGG